MIPVRQSTAFECSVGPVLDADGVAVTDCVVGDFKIKKTTGNFAALNGSATLTHVSAGTYDLVLTTSDLDTVGLATIAIDDTVNACAPVRLQVIEEAVYDIYYAASATAKAPATIAAGDIANNAITAAAAAADFGAELQALITGGAYTISTDANGRVRVVDGTGTGELDTASGAVLVVATSIRTALGMASADLDSQLAALPTAGEITDAVWDEPQSSHVLNGSTGESLDNAGNAGTPPSVADIADGVWDELLAGHAGAGSAGAALAAAGSAGDPWSTALPGSYTAGQAGKIIGDNLNATVGSRSSHSAANVWAVTTRELTAGTNIVLAKGTGVTGFNDITAASVWAVATRTLSALGFDLAAGDFASNWLTADGAATDLIQEIRNAVTGGAYAISTDANGRVRIVDGTGAGELDTTSGLVKISGTIQTLDALDTAQDVEHDATQAAIGALSIPTVAQILTTQMTESYAANGVAPTLAQAMFAVHQKLMAHEYVGTQSRTYRLDDVTLAFTGTLDDDTNPTSDRRAA